MRISPSWQRNKERRLKPAMIGLYIRTYINVIILVNSNIIKPYLSGTGFRWQPQLKWGSSICNNPAMITSNSTITSLNQWRIFLNMLRTGGKGILYSNSGVFIPFRTFLSSLQNTCLIEASGSFSTPTSFWTPEWLRCRTVWTWISHWGGKRRRSTNRCREMA